MHIKQERRGAGTCRGTGPLPPLRTAPEVEVSLEVFKDINRRFNAFVQKIVQEHYSSFDKVSPSLGVHGTEAFILEMFRHSSFLPFTIPHSTTKATVLNGYYIPKDTCVFINQWQVNHDERLWKEPWSFRPERFLSAAGAELRRAESEKVLSFGLGRRRCLGETIGRWEIFLFLTTLLQQLRFSLRPGERVDATPQYGLTMKYKKCEAFQIRPRFGGGSAP
ncbi:cytochrome P450 1A4-like [Passer montanus]|uniref:cytochrome P450 1A4-like n=1 Tax=Passer montanus TaxID=9160 RepID=UPI00196050D6|nr:cytochrome P450 1A4-like [Passer montanus]